jgi:hypothetical protein
MNFSSHKQSKIPAQISSICNFSRWIGDEKKTVRSLIKRKKRKEKENMKEVPAAIGLQNQLFCRACSLNIVATVRVPKRAFGVQIGFSEKWCYNN